MNLPDALSPYIAGAQPDERGEVEMFCPLHPDSRRSASLNIENGAWYCFAGCGGGSLRHLLDYQEDWEPMEGREIPAWRMTPRGRSVVAPSIDLIEAYHRRLMRDKELLGELKVRRGIDKATARKALLGHDGSHYKIPVFAPSRKIWNIRSYDMNLSPNSTRRKIWSVRGMGQPRLYPISVLSQLEPGDDIIICEGEWDALLTLQSGHAAITRTGAADVWRPFWSRRFRGLNVYLCHDMDEKGMHANDTVLQALGSYPKSVKTMHLPYEVTDKHGKDLTDFLLDTRRVRRRLALRKLKRKAK